MGLWKWEGYKNGKRVSGKEEARNQRELIRMLKIKKITPVKVSPPSIMDIDLGLWMVEKGLASPFKNADLMLFTKQLSIMISGGIPILQSLEIIYKQTYNPSLKVSVKNIAAAVGSGKTLSDAMSVEKGFEKLYVNLIEAGEKGGVLDHVLDKLHTYLEKREETKKKVKGALAYPIIVVVVGIGVITFMLIFVVPMFTDMFKDAGKELPFLTQMVVDISDFLKEWFPLIIIVLVGAVFGISYASKNPSTKPGFDKFMMTAPVFGIIIIKSSMNTFSSTLATMLSSGVSLVDSLEICSKVIDNTVIGNDVLRIKKAVEEGSTLAEPLMKIKYFPEMISQMVKIGEQTGNLDSMFEKISTVFEKEVDDAISGGTKLIEPLILVGLGSVIAVVLVALYLPIFMSGDLA